MDSAAADLRFVKDAVARKELNGASTPVWLPAMWGVIVLAGCVVNDFNPRFAWTYRGTAPRVGFLASWVLGGRQPCRWASTTARRA